MKSLKAKMQARKASGGLLGAELALLAKNATAKTLAAPNEELMQQVVDAVNASSEASGARELRDVLHKRLNMKNPHKVWLATYLAETVLKDCTDVIKPVRSDLYQDLGAVASKPLDRYQANFKDEQRAKMNAFAILRNSGKQGQNTLRHACKMGRMVSLTPMPDNRTKSRLRPDGTFAPESRSNSETEKSDSDKKAPEVTEGAKSPEAAKSPTEGGASGSSSGRGGGGSGRGSKKPKMSWPEVKDAVTTSLGISASHTSMVQDLVLNITSGESEEPEFERQFLGELVEEMLTFRSAFEQLLGVLSSFKQDEAKSLVQQALEAVDEMNSVLASYKQAVGEAPRNTSAAGPSGSNAPAGPSRASRPGSGGSGSGSGARRGAPGQYPPAALKATRSNSGPTLLDTTSDLGSALPLRDPDRTAGSGSRKGDAARTMQRANSAGRSSGRGDPFQPSAALTQQYGMPPGALSQASLPPGALSQAMLGQQVPPQYFMQAPPVYYAQPSAAQGQAPQQGLPQGFMPMPMGGGQQPIMYMPVTGPNGEQGFAPVIMPGGQLPTSGSMMMQPPYAPTSGPYGAVSPSSAVQPSAFAGAPIGSAAAPPPQQPQLVEGHGSNPPSANPFAPSASGGLASGVSVAPGMPSAAAQVPPAQSAAEQDGGVTDSDAEGSLPHVMSSDSLARPFRRASSSSSLQAGAIPHVVSASSDIFPGESASGVLADAGLKPFQPQLAQPSLPPAAYTRLPVPASAPADLAAASVPEAVAAPDHQ